MEENEKHSFETVPYSEFVDEAGFFLGIKAFKQACKEPERWTEFHKNAFRKDLKELSQQQETAYEKSNEALILFNAGHVRDYSLLGILKEIYCRRHKNEDIDPAVKLLECIDFDQKRFDELGYDISEFEERYFEIAYFLLHSKIFREEQIFALPDNLTYLLSVVFPPDPNEKILLHNCNLGEFLIPLRGHNVETTPSADARCRGFVTILLDAISAYFGETTVENLNVIEDADSFQQIIYVSPKLMSEQEDEFLDFYYDKLEIGGRMAMVVRTSWLTKPFENESFRKSGIGKMYADNAIWRIIQLPQNAVYQTSASVSIVIVAKSSNIRSIRSVKINMTDLTDEYDSSTFFSFPDNLSIEEYRSEVNSWINSETYNEKWRFYNQIEADDSLRNTSNVEFEYLKEHKGILVPSLYRIPYYYQPCHLAYVKEPIDHPAELEQVDVVTEKSLSQVFPVAQVSFDPIDNMFSGLKDSLLYQGPAALFYRENGKTAVGYVKDDRIFECPKGITVLGANNNSVQALAGLLLEYNTEDQIKKIDAGENCFGKYPEHFQALRFDERLVPSDFISMKMADVLKEINQELDNAYANYQKEIHRRKHAMSQIVSALSANLNCLVSYVENHIDTSAKVSPRRETTVRDIISSVVRNLEVLEKQTVNLAEVEYHWGHPEEIDPQEFLSDYVHQNKSLKYQYVFDFARPNKYISADGKEGKEASFMCPTAALSQIMSNIVANAEAHGFTDPDHDGYKIRMHWSLEDGQVVIYIANNGTPMNKDLDPEEALKYGVSTAFNDKAGHSGIGCYDIKNIIEKQGGSVAIRKLSDQEYTVEYILKFPKKKGQE